eukprot:1702654-Prymnesium_polylepis.1
MHEASSTTHEARPAIRNNLRTPWQRCREGYGAPHGRISSVLAHPKWPGVLMSPGQSVATTNVGLRRFTPHLARRSVDAPVNGDRVRALSGVDFERWARSL